MFHAVHPDIEYESMSREYRDHNHSVPNSFFFRSVTKFQFETHQEIINHCQANGISPKYSSARVEIHSFSRLSPRWSARYNGEQKMNDMTTCRGGGKFKKKKKFSLPFLARTGALRVPCTKSGRSMNKPRPQRKACMINLLKTARAKSSNIPRVGGFYSGARAALLLARAAAALRGGLHGRERAPGSASSPSEFLANLNNVAY